MVKAFVPIDSTMRSPFLRTVNGFGCRFSGWLADPVNPVVYYKIHWLTFLFIPVLPLGVYALHKDQSSYPNYLIFGRVPVSTFAEKFGRRALKPLFNSYFEGVAALAAFAALIFVVAALVQGIRHGFR